VSLAEPLRQTWRLRGTVSAMVRPFVASLVAAAALLLSVVAAGAHTGPQISATPPAAPDVRPAADLRAAAPAAVTWPALVAVAVALVACTSRRRLALTVALLTTVVGVDATIHSVHHLHDSAAADACVLASTSAQAPAVLTDVAIVVVAPAPAADARVDVVPIRLALRASRPDRGRAPPSSAA